MFFWAHHKNMFPNSSDLVFLFEIQNSATLPIFSFFFFQIWISPLNLDPICGQPFLRKIPTSRKDFLLLLLFLFQLVQFDHPPASCRRGIFENSQPNRPKMDALQSVEPSWKNHFYWQQRKGRQEKKRIFLFKMKERSICPALPLAVGGVRIWKLVSTTKRHVNNEGRWRQLPHSATVGGWPTDNCWIVFVLNLLFLSLPPSIPFLFHRICFVLLFRFPCFPQRLS